MPYLSPIERLILAIGAPTLGTGDWYYNFLSDPIQFFVERGVQRITYLGGSEPDQQTENPDKRDNEKSDRFTDKQWDGFTDKLKDSIALKKSNSR